MGYTLLTDLKARKAVPKEKNFKLFDGLGLYLFITKGGTKSWRLKYNHGGKEGVTTMGRYPEVGISDARKLRDEFRRQMAEGREPKLIKKRHKLLSARPDLSFEAVVENGTNANFQSGPNGMRTRIWTPV